MISSKTCEVYRFAQVAVEEHNQNFRIITICSETRQQQAGYTSAIPENARVVRNLLMGGQFVHDHPVHFYHLHALDWVDIVSALKADPKKTAALADNVSNAKVGGSAYYKQVQQRIQTFVDSGQLGPFSNAYWGHPAYKLPPEANLMAVAHYLEALAWQRDVVKLHAIFGFNIKTIKT